MLTLLVFAGAVLVYFWLFNPDNFPIKTVRIEADYAHISQPQLQNTIAPYVKASFFGLHAAALKASLQQISWVGSVNIRRKFPATIIIAVVEKQPILVWNQTDLMTADGVLFTPPAGTFPKNLPALAGPLGSEQLVFSTMNQINQMLQVLNLTAQQLNLSPRGAWTMQLSNGIEVFIGQQEIGPRLQQFVKIYPEVVGGEIKRVVSVDLRYPNGVAVMWKH